MAVTALYRYPVKSMLGEALERCRIDESGIVGDRAYALVDVETGTVASAKVPRRWGGLLGFSARCVGEPERDVAPSVEITFPDGSVHHSGDADIDAGLSAAIGRDVRLVATPPEGAGFEEVWPEIDGLAPEAVIAGTRVRDEDTGERVSRFDLAAMSPHPAFFDLAVLHLLTTATLRRLHELAPAATFDERRYRPNVVLDEPGDGFPENTWAGRSIAFAGGVTVAASIPTMRCVMTTLAQGDLPRDPDTLRTIAKHNRVEIPGLGTWACAGTYADVTAGGELAVGEEHELR
ncbi:MOSC N-terminal beta barrel domain-containing protein [Pseudonocardia sp. DSM 110487]|uniref:MOSC domain-containing protein n=1 Tax=Pseudonocardia sp. DSM 110487 TaxID=2865833 RepID=UPI001C6A4713|nr:MOSC N-terminal beta barrel domain-containing protein [Pseudonocardia sp. DSM 110487]QYN35559.1 MOSC N-terminal beta barrel domain-containing protein [Pseudonocardia sp. DSM 110487]